MPRNKLKYRLLLVLLGLAFVFLLLEVGLRIAGFIYDSYKIKNKSGIQVGNNSFRILCIGDSYTFGHGAPAGFSYPEQLEKMLNKDNPLREFIVYNRGICGANSSKVLKEMPENLQKYDPEAIIVMVGMNNVWNLEESNYFLFKKGPGVYLYRTDAFLSRLRSYKLLKILVRNLKNRLFHVRNTRGNSKNADISVSGVSSCAADEDEGGLEEADMHFKLGQEYLNARELKLAIEEFRKAIELNPCYYRAFIGLGDAYDCEGDYDLAEKALREAIQINPNHSDAYGLLWKTYWHAGKNDLALEVIRDELGLNPFDDDLRRILRNGLPCLSREKEILGRVLEYDLENICRLSVSGGKKVILLTYPLGEDTDDIRNSMANKWHIPLVDIKKRFDELRSSENYKKEEYFVEDYHCNGNGYRVIAQEVYNALKSEGLSE
jgi:lysophospholipase L1-like esterase